jgi:uncharacterized protein YaaQ
VKLIVCVVHNRDRNRLTEDLLKAGFKFTVIGSTGGFLREGNTTLLAGVMDGDFESFKGIVAKQCSSREQVVAMAPFEGPPGGAMLPGAVSVPVGGAVMFVLKVDEFLRF